MYNRGALRPINIGRALAIYPIGMNTSPNTSTDKSLYLLLYGREPKTKFSAPEEDGFDFVQRQKKLLEEAAEAVLIGQARIKVYYDAKHTLPVLGKSVPTHIQIIRKGLSFAELHKATL